MRPSHIPALLLALALSACCEPDDPDSTTETDTGETGSGSGGVAECVDEFVTCDKGGTPLVCMTCLAGNRVPCSCLGPEGEAVLCYVFDASLC